MEKTKPKCVNLRCDQPQKAKQLCKRHYDDLHYGRIVRIQKRHKGLLDGTTDRFDPNDYDDFWEWVKKELSL